LPHLGADTLFEMRFSHDKETMTLGEELTLTVQVLHHEDYELLPLPEDLGFGPFEVKRIEKIGPFVKGSDVEEGYRVVLTVFELGPFRIPPFAVSFLDDKKKRGHVLTEDLEIQVLSVGRTESDTNDIRPINEPFAFPPRFDPVKFVGIALPVFLALLILIYLVRKALLRKRESAQALLTPYERALARLEKLEKWNVTDQGTVKTFFIELSDVLRRYFIEEYQTGSLDETTREFLDQIARGTFEEGTSPSLKEILSLADLVKFAKWMPAETEIRGVLKQSREIVERNKPREETQALVASKKGSAS